MFEKYFRRVEPKDQMGVLPSTTAPTPSQSQHEVTTSTRVGRKRSKSRSSNMDKALRLTAEQKCDIAQREIEEFREEIENLREESEKVLDTYRVRRFDERSVYNNIY